VNSSRNRLKKSSKEKNKKKLKDKRELHKPERSLRRQMKSCLEFRHRLLLKNKKKSKESSNMERRRMHLIILKRPRKKSVSETNKLSNKN